MKAIYIGMTICLYWSSPDLSWTRQVLRYSKTGHFCDGGGGEVIAIKKRKSGTYLEVKVLSGSYYSASTVLINAKDSIR